VVQSYSSDLKRDFLEPQGGPSVKKMYSVHF